MTGMAALAMCAAFTSCTKDTEFEQLTQAQIDESKYEAAFESRFGKIASNQDWGFGQFRKGASARTREADPRGNMWAQEGWNVPPVITDAQKDIVRRYFQQNTPLGYNGPGWTNFWIQQVYKGGSNTGDGSLTTEVYTIGNGDSVTGGDNMDHLCSKDENGTEDHINDFNNSDNNDWEGRMLMVNSSTYSFGYINSNATAIHYDKAALVHYSVIQEWANAHGLNGDILEDGWNRSYMGFDWEQAIGDDVYAKDWQTGDYSTFEFGGKTYRYLIANANQYAYDETEPVFGGKKNYNDKPSDEIIAQLLDLGYLPYSDTQKDWIKLSTGADGYYSDWIVTLTEAKQTTPEYPEADVRVIVEDMSASEQWDGQEFSGDFDFNDVVFDVIYDYDATQSAIILQAAGGTLPLYVAGHEVHDAFGVGTSDMVNTDAGPVCAPVLIPLGVKYDDARDIIVTVEKPGYPEAVELQAVPGRAPHKIAVPTDFDWMTEWQDIDGVYPLFSDYVNDPSVRWTK